MWRQRQGHSIGVWVVDGRAEGNGTGLWALRKDRAWGTGMGSGPVALGKGESWGTGIGMARASNDIRAMENSHQCSAEDFGRAQDMGDGVGHGRAGGSEADGNRGRDWAQVGGVGGQMMPSGHQATQAGQQAAVGTARLGLGTAPGSGQQAAAADMGHVLVVTWAR